MLRKLAAALLAAMALPALAAPLGTTITYQGHLLDGQQPANDLYDFELCVFDQMIGGAQLACAPAFDKVPVEAGIFTVEPDFGANVFQGEARFLEIRVRNGDAAGGDPYTILAPRQRLAPAPEALHSRVSANMPWSGLTGVPADLQDGDSLGVTGVISGFGLVAAPPITTQGTIAVDTAVMQRRVAQNCGTGALSAIAQNGSATCNPMVTGISAGTGLATNPPGMITGSGTISIANGGVGAQQINAQQVQLRILGSCPAGQYMRAIAQNGAPTCESAPASSAGIASFVVLDDPANQVGEFSSMAIGLDGNPVVSYYDSTADALKVVKCSDSACTGPVTISTVEDGPNDVGRYNSIAVRGDGRPIISYHDASAGTVRVASCNNAACTSASVNVIGDLANVVGRHTAIGINGSGTIFIAYQDLALNALKVATCQDAACANSIIAVLDDHATNVLGLGISMAVHDSPDALPRIAYLDFTNDGLKFAACTSANCATSTVETLDDSVNAITGETSIAIRPPFSLPIISYHDSTFGSLEIASCTSQECSGVVNLSTVDNPAETVGRFSSIGVGKDGLARISYIDTTNSALRFGKCNNWHCTSLSVVSNIDDTSSFMSRPTTLRLRADGIPAIAYSDTAGRMLFTTCGTSSCQ